MEDGWGWGWWEGGAMVPILKCLFCFLHSAIHVCSTRSPPSSLLTFLAYSPSLHSCLRCLLILCAYLPFLRLSFSRLLSLSLSPALSLSRSFFFSLVSPRGSSSLPLSSSPPPWLVNPGIIEKCSHLGCCLEAGNFS